MCGEPRPSQKANRRRRLWHYFWRGSLLFGCLQAPHHPEPGYVWLHGSRDRGVAPRRDQLVVSFILLARRSEYVTRRARFGSIY